MNDILNVLAVSGGQMETDDNGILNWGNLLCLADPERDINSMTVGRDIYKMKFHMPKEQVQGFVLEMKKLIAALPHDKPVLQVELKLGRKKSKTGEAVQVVTGFATK